MKLCSVIPCILVLIGSCTKTKEPTAFDQDVDKICQAIKNANAEALSAHDQALVVAQYLGGNLKTEKGRDLSLRMSQSKVTERGAILLEAAQKSNISDCPMVDVFNEEP